MYWYSIKTVFFFRSNASACNLRVNDVGRCFHSKWRNIQILLCVVESERELHSLHNNGKERYHNKMFVLKDGTIRFFLLENWREVSWEVANEEATKIRNEEVTQYVTLARETNIWYLIIWKEEVFGNKMR